MAIPQFDFTDKPTNQFNTAQTTFDFSDPEPAQAQTSMADFRQADAESMNQLGVARAEAMQNMPDFMKPAFMGLGRIESKIVDPVLNNPWVSRASQTGGEIVTMVDNPNKDDTGSGFGNISADLVGALTGFVANPESAGQKIWNFGEKTLGRALADTVPKAPGMVKEGIKAAGATIPFEATRMIVNDREADPAEMGIAIGANAVLSALTHGLLKPEDVKFSPEGIPIKANYMGAEVPIVEAQKKMTYPWAREPQGNYINTEAMQRAQGEKAQAHMDSMNNQNIWEKLSLAAEEAKQRISDRNEAYKPGNMNAVARNPLDDMKDLATIGAAKIHKGVTDFAAWSREMLAEFGEIIRAKLNDIWEASKAVLNNERGSIRFGGGQQQDTLSHLVSKTDREPVNWAGAGEKAYATVIDDLNRIGKFDDRLDEVHFQATGKHLNPEDRAYLSAINSKEAGGTTKTIVTSNLVDRNGNAIGKPLQSITEQIPKGQFKQMNDYLVLKNAGSWMAKGKQVYPRSMPEFYEPTQKIALNLAKMEEVSKSTVYTDQQKAVIIDALQKENDTFMSGINDLLGRRIAEYEQANPVFKKISDELYAFDKAFKEEWLVNSGVISKEAWEAMQAEHPNYVKFQRKLDKAETGGAYQKGAGGQPVKRAKGSERPIINPIESMVEDIDRIVNIARKQEVRQLMYENMAKYPEEMQGFGRITYEGEIPRAARKAPEEGELRDIIDNKIDELGFDPKHGNTVPVQVNGRTEHIVFYDPALLEALQALDPKASGIIINAAREVSRTMKVLTTGANPLFSSRNFARDLPMAYIFSDTLAKTPVKRELQFAWGIVDSMARVVTGGRYDPGGFYKTYKALGGGSHTSSIASDRNILAETMGAILPNEEKSVLSKVKGAGRGIEAFTNAVETIPRLPEYVRTVQQMGDTAGARKLGLNRAQDLVNFSRKGSMSGEADAVIPYLNASLQAIDKIVRTFKNNPLEATQRAFIAITIPAVMLWMINKDNPDYQQLSSWTKDNYYCIPTNDGKFIKIAKPREVGVLFASLPERCLDTWANDDPEGFRNFAAAWEANFLPANRPIWAPFTDVAANKSFSGTPIIPGYQEKLSPELQYDESTSIPAKAIGGALGVSPKKIDYIGRSYTGVIGQLGIPATSGNGGLGESLSRNLLSDSLYSTDILTNFYNDKAKLDTASADYDATGKPGKNYDPEKLKMYNRAARDISALKEQMRTINASDIDPGQKEFALRGLQEKILNIARQVKSGTYGNGSANWITQWQARL